MGLFLGFVGGVVEFGQYLAAELADLGAQLVAADARVGRGVAGAALEQLQGFAQAALDGELYGGFGHAVHQCTLPSAPAGLQFLT